MKLSIVAGGFSFKEVDHAKIPHPVIAINDALLYLECAVEAVVSMDRLWTEGRWDILVARAIPAHIRKAALKRVPWQNNTLNWLSPFDNDHTTAELSDNPTILNGTNSGTCGLNLAYTMRPTELYMFGFDMQPGPDGERRWYPLASWERDRQYDGSKGYKFGTWSAQMHTVRSYFDAIGCTVYNVSSRSIIKAFERKTPQQMGMDK